MNMNLFIARQEFPEAKFIEGESQVEDHMMHLNNEYSIQIGSVDKYYIATKLIKNNGNILVKDGDIHSDFLSAYNEILEWKQ